MSAVRQGTVGATRICPHCKATILDSASVCPACRGHLRFEPGIAKRESPTLQSTTPLSVEGTIRQPTAGGASEYSVLLSIRNKRGEEITRQVLGVGALRPGDERTFSFTVQMSASSDAKGAGTDKTGR